MEKREIEAIVREVLERTLDAQSRTNPVSMSGLQMPVNTPGQADFGTATFVKSMTEDSPGTAVKQLTGAHADSVQPAMSLSLAVRLIEKIEAKAAEWNMRVVTAVSDASGRPAAVHCMDGAYIGSFDVALNKTYTAVAFQMSTEQLGRLSQPGESLYGIQFTNGGRIVIFGGGELLRRNGVIIGALGVSGGSAAQDTALAAYGKDIFGSL